MKAIQVISESWRGLQRELAAIDSGAQVKRHPAMKGPLRAEAAEAFKLGVLAQIDEFKKTLPQARAEAQRARERALANIRQGRAPDYRQAAASEIQDPRPWDSPELAADRVDRLRGQRSLEGKLDELLRAQQQTNALELLKMTPTAALNQRISDWREAAETNPAKFDYRRALGYKPLSETEGASKVRAILAASQSFTPKSAASVSPPNVGNRKSSSVLQRISLWWLLPEVMTQAAPVRVEPALVDPSIRKPLDLLL
jgi:hypothetical protein